MVYHCQACLLEYGQKHRTNTLATFQHNLILEIMIMPSPFPFLLFFPSLILGNRIRGRVLNVARMLRSKYSFVLILVLTLVLLKNWF